MRSRIEMRTWGWLAVFAVALVVTSTPSALADPPEDAGRELAATDRVIEEAKEIVGASRNEQAQELLNLAISLQESARDAFRRKQYREALEFTHKAREEARRAIRMAKGGMDPKEVERALRRTDDIIAKAREVVGESPNEQAQKLLETAIDEQNRAREAYRKEEHEMAMRMTRSAEEMARRAMEMARGDGHEERRVREALERTDRLIEKAAPAIRESGNREAIRLFDKAIDLQRKAWDLFRDHRYREAFHMTMEARELIHKALRLVEGPVDAQEVERAIKATDELIERVGPRIRNSGDKHAIGLLETGLLHQGHAKEHFRQERYRAALAETKVAYRLVMKAWELIKDKDTDTEVHP